MPYGHLPGGPGQRTRRAERALRVFAGDFLFAKHNSLAFAFSKEPPSSRITSVSLLRQRGGLDFVCL